MFIKIHTHNVHIHEKWISLQSVKIFKWNTGNDLYLLFCLTLYMYPEKRLVCFMSTSFTCFWNTLTQFLFPICHQDHRWKVKVTGVEICTRLKLLYYIIFFSKFVWHADMTPFMILVFKVKCERSRWLDGKF